MAFSSTHPIDSYHPRQHLGTTEFKARLEAALNSHYPDTGKELLHYDSVSVLLLLWEDDELDLDCGKEVGRLQDVLSKSYGYSTTVLKIPTARTEEWLYDTLIDFARGKTTRDLIIVYYAGHGVADRNRSPCLGDKSAYREIAIDHVSQFGQRGLHAPPPWARTFVKQTWVNFVKSRDYLCSRSCDVLFLLDCCYATGAVIGTGKELIAASAIEAPTKTSRCSFTTALIQELEHASPFGNYLTAAMLYRNPLQKSSNGSLPFSPIHAELLYSRSRTSILLIPERNSNLTRPIPAWWPNNIPVSVPLNVHL